MKAVILAAGLGRRMQPLTLQTHKTLLPIADSTILHRILGALEQNGVNDVCIVTGFRAEEVRRAALDHFHDLNLEFIHNPQYATTNNVFSMSLALDALDISDDILLIESDLIFDPRVLQQIIETPHKNAALIDRYRPGLDGTVVSLSTDGIIAQVYPSYLQEAGFDYSNKYKTLNIYRFDKDFCRSSFRNLLSFYSRAFDSNCYYELLLGVLIYVKAAVVVGVPVAYEWAEVDDPNDLTGAAYAFDPPARRSIVESAWGGYWNFPHTDFAFVRNMHFPTPPVIAEIRSHLDALLQDYGSSQLILDQKLSYLLQCDQRCLCLLNGASQVFPVLKRFFAGRTVALPSPTFGEYPRAFPAARTYADGPPIDLAEVAAAGSGADVLVVVNPNNPTGSTLSSRHVLDLVAEDRGRYVIIDESFIEFSEEPSVLPDIERAGYANAAVLKSLSKSLGVPGIRLGYIYSQDAPLMDAIRTELPVWNINSVAENFLEIILKHRAAIDESYAKTKEDRSQFASGLSGLGIVDRVFPSGANFLLVRLRCTPVRTAELADRLMAQHRIHVKDVSAKFTDERGHLRLAVRLPDENLALCELLAATQ